MSIFKTLLFVSNHPLNRNNKLEAVWRYFSWQIISRMAPGAIVFDWVNGAKFLVRNGETGLTGNIYTGLHEFPEMAFLLHFLREDDLFVDIGANLGSYTILAGAAVGANGYAFEPVPATHKRLVENLRLNNIDEAVDHPNIGIANKRGTIRFSTDSDTANHVIADDEIASSEVSVETRTLDAVLNGVCPSLLKIDVEGFELPVLLGAERTLANPALNALIIELNGSGDRYGYDESEIVEMLFLNGFRSYVYNPFSRSLMALSGKNPATDNSLFLRNIDDVECRLRSSPGFQVNGRFF